MARGATPRTTQAEKRVAKPEARATVAPARPVAKPAKPAAADTPRTAKGGAWRSLRRCQVWPD